MGKVHRRTNEKKLEDCQQWKKHTQRYRARTSLKSALVLRTTVFNLKETIEDACDVTTESYEAINEVAGSRNLTSRKVAYYGSVYALYNLPKHERDLGIIKMMKKKRNDPNFVIKLYSGTSRAKKSCVSIRKGGNSQVVKLIDGGATCYKQMYIFNGGATAENKASAYHWQMFWRAVGQRKKWFKKSTQTMQFDILHETNMHESSYTGGLDGNELDIVYLYASTNVDILPPSPNLLPLDQNPPFLKFELKATR